MEKDKVTDFFRHIFLHSKFGKEILQDMFFLFVDYPVNSKGKKIYDYKIAFKLKGKALDGFLMNKLRSLATVNGVEKHFIDPSIGSDVSFWNKMAKNYLDKENQSTKEQINNLYESGMYAGKAEYVFYNNILNIHLLFKRIYKKINENKKN